MIGLMMITAILGYIFLTFFIVERIEPKAAKIIVLIIMILIPTWDVIAGKIYFRHLCKTEGGLKVYKKIKADGFLNTSIKADISKGKVNRLSKDFAKDILDYGFKFYEVPTSDGKIVHFYKDENGKVAYKILDKPKSRYKYVSEGKKEISKILGIKQVDVYKFVDIDTNETLVKSSWFVRDGWIGRLVKKWLGGGFGEGCVGNKDDSIFFRYRLLKGDFDE